MWVKIPTLEHHTPLAQEMFEETKSKSKPNQIKLLNDGDVKGPWGGLLKTNKVKRSLLGNINYNQNHSIKKIITRTSQISYPSCTLAKASEITIQHI